MPFSDADGKDWSLARFAEILPDVVLDIGPGTGTYADLMRPTREGHWTGVEVWAPYVAEYSLAAKYDRVIVADARYLDPRYFDADLVIAGDVLEHMAAHDAIRLIEAAKKHAANLLISVPLVHLEQGAWGGNPYETHVDHWTAEAMSVVVGRSWSYIGETLGCWWWNRKEHG